MSERDETGTGQPKIVSGRGTGEQVWRSSVATREEFERALRAYGDARGRMVRMPNPPEDDLKYERRDSEVTSTFAALLALWSVSGEGRELQRRFPILGTGGRVTVPWGVAEQAYIVYANKYGTSQTLERLAERGGLSADELDALHPTWRAESFPVREGRELTERYGYVLAMEVLQSPNAEVYDEEVSAAIKHFTRDGVVARALGGEGTT